MDGEIWQEIEKKEKKMSEVENFYLKHSMGNVLKYIELFWWPPNGQSVANLKNDYN